MQAQAIGQRGIDIHGFLGDTALLVRTHELQGAHIVQAVGQLDEEHAHVLVHGQDHLADVLGLLLFLAVKGEHADLGHAVHNVGHVFAKGLVQVFDSGLGVLHRVMQEPCGHGSAVQAHVGQRIGCGQGVGEVGLSGLTGLARVGGGGKDVGLAHQFHIFRALVLAHFVENVLNADHRACIL